MAKPKAKKKGVRKMELLFVILIIIGAVGIQLGNGWMSKNEFGPMAFLSILPLLIAAQYFIGWGYHEGTVQTGFITTFIVWTAVSVFATVGINYVLFQNIPGPVTFVALALASIASVIAVLGK